MKAAIIQQYGKPDVFHIEDVPDIHPDSHEVKIKVYAGSVNPIDYKTRSGSLSFLSGRRFPKILGSDFCGVVTECGAEVRGVKPGDAVYGYVSGVSGQGAYAEYVCCDPSRIAAKPPAFTDSEAGATPLAALTAYQGLYREGRLSAGMRVLITGATGGVGHFAVQIAKAADCHVTGVCYSANEQLARRFGCDEVLPYDRSLFYNEQNKPYDLIFDAVGKFGYFTSAGNLSGNGTYVSTLPFPATMLMHVLSSVRRKRRGRFVSANSNTADLMRIAALAEQGLLKPHIENVFPVRDIARAHEQSETQKARGKIAVEVRDGF